MTGAQEGVRGRVGWGANPNISLYIGMAVLGFAPQPTLVPCLELANRVQHLVVDDDGVRNVIVDAALVAAENHERVGKPREAP